MISDVLLDPAGVIYEGEKALPVDAVDRLRRTRNLEAFRHLGLHARRTAFAATCALTNVRYWG